jgi:hypothetical protein
LINLQEECKEDRADHLQETGGGGPVGNFIPSSGILNPSPRLSPVFRTAGGLCDIQATLQARGLAMAKVLNKPFSAGKRAEQVKHERTGVIFEISEVLIAAIQS